MAETHPPLPGPSVAERRFAHGLGLFATGLWWVYAFYATGFFSAISGAGLAVYLLGVPACYVLGYGLARGLVFVVMALR